MADYSCAARSNYFLVKDREAFDRALEPFDIDICERASDERICLLVTISSGWPNYLYDEESDDDIDIDIAELVAPHLAGDDVALFVEAGAEKLRYVNGWAIAVNGKGERREVHLSDIYDLAKELGSCTQAEY